MTTGLKCRYDNAEPLCYGPGLMLSVLNWILLCTSSNNQSEMLTLLCHNSGLHAQCIELDTTVHLSWIFSFQALVAKILQKEILRNDNKKQGTFRTCQFLWQHTQTGPKGSVGRNP